MNDKKNLNIEKNNKKPSLNQINLEKWLNKGYTIPICINKNCNNTVAIRHWTAQGDPSLRTECRICIKARLKNKTIDGIDFHKKNCCENSDGILGFICPVDKNRYNEFPSDIYHLDHKDGNHHNNDLNNLMTLCSICHTRKGRENKDFNSFKKSSRIHNKL